MSEETKNLNHTDQKKGEDALKGLSMKERKKALEEKKEKRRTKLYIAIGVVVCLSISSGVKMNSGSSMFSSTITMPIRMANTGPPTTSKRFPSSHAGTAITRQSKIPHAYFFKKFIDSSQMKIF